VAPGHRSGGEPRRPPAEPGPGPVPVPVPDANVADRDAAGPVAIHLRVDTAPDAAAVAALERGLDEFNADQGLPAEGRAPFAVFAEAEDGMLVGGAAGDVRWGWLKVKYLWVAPARRREGWGSRLLDQVERWAREQGCVALRLSTYSFQALPFYLACGFEVQYEVADYPPGHSKYYLVKALLPG
jgi:GNAT superfamily N-acetyltransferase